MWESGGVFFGQTATTVWFDNYTANGSSGSPIFRNTPQFEKPVVQAIAVATAPQASPPHNTALRLRWAALVNINHWKHVSINP